MVLACSNLTWTGVETGEPPTVWLVGLHYAVRVLRRTRQDAAIGCLLPNHAEDHRVRDHGLCLLVDTKRLPGMCSPAEPWAETR